MDEKVVVRETVLLDGEGVFRKAAGTREAVVVDKAGTGHEIPVAEDTEPVAETVRVGAVGVACGMRSAGGVGELGEAPLASPLQHTNFRTQFGTWGCLAPFCDCFPDSWKWRDIPLNLIFEKGRQVHLTLPILSVFFG